MTDSRLVVLGAGGFVGRHVVLQARSMGMEVLPLTSEDVDLTDSLATLGLRNTLRPTDVLVHAAGRVPARTAHEFRTNLLMSENVGVLLQEQPVAHQVIVSSDAVYGSAGGAINEESVAAPDSIHGLMSLSREYLLMNQVQFASSVARLAPVYGPGDTHSSYGPNRFFHSAYNHGQITVFGKGLARRDHVYIDDVALALVALAVKRVASIVNIASGQSQSFANVARITCSVLEGSKIAHQGTEGRIFHRHYDISNLKLLLPGYVPTMLAEGMRRYLNQGSSAART